jgi:uncharacterized membrane protein (Fun14 family)
VFIVVNPAEFAKNIEHMCCQWKMGKISAATIGVYFQSDPEIFCASLQEAGICDIDGRLLPDTSVNKILRVLTIMMLLRQQGVINILIDQVQALQKKVYEKNKV